jgi:methylated-DNA-protein-cysteine methyltransferase-like protein
MAGRIGNPGIECSRRTRERDAAVFRRLIARGSQGVAEARADRGDLKTYERIYRAVGRIPRGRVCTYGQIAELAGLPGGARQVGYALAALGDTRVPWHRVVNSRGEISPRAEPSFEALQRQLLAREGVAFDATGRLSLARFRWRPRRSGRARKGRRPQRNRSPR